MINGLRNEQCTILEISFPGISNQMYDLKTYSFYVNYYVTMYKHKINFCYHPEPQKTTVSRVEDNSLGTCFVIVINNYDTLYYNLRFKPNNFSYHYFYLCL